MQTSNHSGVSQKGILGKATLKRTFFFFKPGGLNLDCSTFTSFGWLLIENTEKWEKHFDVLHIALGLPMFRDTENTPNMQISVQANETISINDISLKNYNLWDDC